MDSFVVGQRWRFRGAQGQEDSTLIIGRIDRRFLRSSIIHVSIARETKPIGHMPFVESALRASVISLVEAGVTPPPAFAGGIEHWEKAHGGAFSIPVAEAIAGIESILTGEPETDDAIDFDPLVLEMRAGRTDQHIAALYDKLFALKKWYFLCDPNDHRRPVLWVFNDGPNKSPCLLVFTDRKKATLCARGIGMIPPDGNAVLMPALVPEAIEWIKTGPMADGITWASFNYGRESNNFPLYFEEIIRRTAER